MTKLVRVVANGEDENLVIDVFVDDDRRVVKKAHTGGWLGDLKSNDVYPFVFRIDRDEDQIDLGDSPDSDPEWERFANTNLRSKRIVQGEYLTVTLGDDEFCLRIKDVIELAG